MRNFKELLTGQGEDLFHKNMRKFGATVLESHQAFKDIKEGNIEGGGGSASTWRYFDVSNLTDKSQVKFLGPYLVKTSERVQPASNVSNWSSALAFGVDAKSKVVNKGSIYTWEEAIAAEGITPEVMAQLGAVEITEEEFYTL